jgi:hypothetical protein
MASKPPPATGPRDVLFMTSTIARDETQGREAKEYGMLLELTDKLNTSGKPLKMVAKE